MDKAKEGPGGDIDYEEFLHCWVYWENIAFGRVCFWDGEHIPQRLLQKQGWEVNMDNCFEGKRFRVKFFCV